MMLTYKFGTPENPLRREKGVYANGVYLGAIVGNTDGFYVFFPNEGKGYWSQELLEELAAKLRELNREWEKVIEEELGTPDTESV